MILEGLVTTRNEDGSTNISPMGPFVDREIQTLELRPFASSRTYQNLCRTRQGVFHVTDNVQMLARSAVGAAVAAELFRPDNLAVDVDILADACRWYAFRVTSITENPARCRLHCRIVQSGRLRDFFGFNRAKHAVVEAAILATRIHLVPAGEVAAQLLQLETIVHKTGGDQELDAFEFLKQYVHNTEALNKVAE